MGLSRADALRERLAIIAEKRVQHVGDLAMERRLDADEAATRTELAVWEGIEVRGRGMGPETARAIDDKASQQERRKKAAQEMREMQDAAQKETKA